MTCSSAGKFARDHGNKIIAAAVVVVIGYLGQYQMAEAARLRNETVDALREVSNSVITLEDRLVTVELWKAGTAADRYTVRDAAADQKSHAVVHDRLNREVTDKLEDMAKAISALAAAIGRLQGTIENR